MIGRNLTFQKKNIAYMKHHRNTGSNGRQAGIRFLPIINIQPLPPTTARGPRTAGRGGRRGKGSRVTKRVVMATLSSGDAFKQKKIFYLVVLLIIINWNETAFAI